MKIARVDHWRCDQPVDFRKGGGHTYVWVPDTMTVGEFEALCEKAQQAYFKAEDELREIHPTLPPGYGPRFENFPDKLVSEVLAEHAKLTVAWEKQQALKKAAQRTFTQILKEVSGGSVLGFWDIEFPISTEVHWGHRHGEDVRYGDERVEDSCPDSLGKPEEEDGL
jgi:hypothetical protein